MSAPVADANPLTRKLWNIAGTGDLEQLGKLLNEGAEVNAGDRTGVTALMRAAYHGQLPMVRALIEHGADPNAKDRSGLTALMMAKHTGHQEIVEALLSSGAQAKPKATKPRQVGSLTEEGIRPAANPETTPVKSSEVKTLQEPPDIWELVHTTQPESDSPIVYSPSKTLAQSLSTLVPGKLPSMRALALGAGALVICAAAVFGLVSWRSSGSAPEDAAEQRAEASELKPTSSVDQRGATVKTRNDEARRIARQSDQLTKIAPAGRLWGERDEQLITPAAATAIMPLRKPAGRQLANASVSFGKQNKNVRRTTRPEGDSGTNLKSAKTEQAPPANDPVRPSVIQKPKVIQWP